MYKIEKNNFSLDNSKFLYTKKKKKPRVDVNILSYKIKEGRREQFCVIIDGSRKAIF